MENQSNNNHGGFTLGFGVGAAAGAAFTHFLQSDEGVMARKEVEKEFAAVKKELVVQGLLPSEKMSFIEILSHVLTHMSEFIEEADSLQVSKNDATKKRRRSKKTLVRKETKPSQKKFSGV